MVVEWHTYEHNQRVIADNTNMRGGMARGALRRGEALLAGLLRCAHCDRKLHVAYSGSGSDGDAARYHCKGAAINHGVAHGCICFGSLRVDEAVSREVLSVLDPIGVRAALHCRRRSKSDPPRRSNIDPGMDADRVMVGCGQV